MEIDSEKIAKEIETHSSVRNGNNSVLGEIKDSLETALYSLESLEVSRIQSLPAKLKVKFPKEGLDFYKVKLEFEMSLIKQALRTTNGNQSKAAKLLKMKLTTLNSMIKKNNIEI